MAVLDSGQAGAIEITPHMIDEGVLAFVRNYDAGEDGLENLRFTVSSIISAVFEVNDYGMNPDRGFPRKFGGHD